MWLFSVPATAALPGGSPGYPYGDTLLRSDDLPLDSPLPVLAETPAVAAAGDADYVARVEALESVEGAYGASLSETLSDLARHHEARGEHGQALSLYRRALHLLRVNQGLNSEQQVPLVRAELGLYQKLGDLDALDDRYEYYFRLLGAGKPPLTDLRVRATLSYLRWQREALRQGMAAGAQKRMLNALSLNETLLELVRQSRSQASLAEDASAEHDRWLLDATLSQVNNLYVLQEFFPPQEQDDWLIEAGSGAAAMQQPSFEEYITLRVQRLRRGAMNLGATLLEQSMAELGSGASAMQRAQLALALGDWYQWYGLRAYAANHYRLARELLLSAGATGTLREAFGEPVELPATGVFRRYHTPDPQAQSALRLRFDVSATGRSSNIEVVAAPEGAERAASSAARALRAVRFRPRWLNGEAEAMSGLERSYHRLR
ncbi:MAG: hypothetical protein Hals2KO_23560 [Halioglobus sp.]